MISGLRLESRKFFDYDFREAFPDAQLPSFPLGRDTKAQTLPVFFQGDMPTCVPCSTLWISEWFGLNTGACTTLELAHDGSLTDKGTFPSKVLDVAYKRGLIPNYIYVRDPKNEAEIEKALGISPLIIGLWNWPLVPGGHAMVLLDKLADGSWLCINWANPKKTDFVTLPSDTTFEFAVSFANLTKNNPPFLGPFLALFRKLISYATQVWALTRNRQR